MPRQKTSATAYGITCALSKLARMPRWKAYIPDEMAQLNAAFMHSGKDTLFKRLISALSPGLFINVIDLMYVPGMAHHILFRKRLVESQLKSAVSDGIQQVVILGAGLDTLSIRIAREHKAVRFFEIDLPAVQEAKLKVLDDIRYPLPANCTFIPADLSQASLEETFRTQGRFAPDIPTLVILECVLMYLAEKDVKALFTQLHRLFRNRLCVLFGAVSTPENDANWRSRVFNAFLHHGNEPTLWYCSSQSMPKFMAELGYKMQSWMPYKKLQSYYRGDNEIRSIPAEDENYYFVVKIPQSQFNDANFAIDPISYMPVSS